MVRDAEETVQQRGRAERARLGAPGLVRLFPRPSWTQCCDPFSDTLKGSMPFDSVHEVEVNKHTFRTTLGPKGHTASSCIRPGLTTDTL